MTTEVGAVGTTAVPMQRDRRSRRPAPAPAGTQVVRIESASPLGASLLIPAQRGGDPIAPLLPIRRRALRPGPLRRLLRVAVASGFALGVWVVMVGAVVTLGHTL